MSNVFPFPKRATEYHCERCGLHFGPFTSTVEGTTMSAVCGCGNEFTLAAGAVRTMREAGES